MMENQRSEKEKVIKNIRDLFRLKNKMMLQLKV